jgi:hypothetical protein
MTTDPREEPGDEAALLTELTNALRDQPFDATSIRLARAVLPIIAKAKRDAVVEAYRRGYVDRKNERDFDP